MRGRQTRHRCSLQPSSTKNEQEDKHPKPPRRPARSQDRHGGPLEVKIVVLGASRTGKTAIVNQFLYDKFTPRYRQTIEEMHHGEFDVGGVHMILQVLDTSGTNEFPAMRNLSISNGDAFILVYDLTDQTTFEAIRDIRDHILETKGTEDVPMVIVGNKSDIADPDEIEYKTTESVVMLDWEHGFVGASAKENINITRIFQEVLRQAKVIPDHSPIIRKNRRQSLPPSQAAGSRGGVQRGSPAASTSRGPRSVSASSTPRSHQRRGRDDSRKRTSCITS